MQHGRCQAPARRSAGRSGGRHGAFSGLSRSSQLGTPCATCRPSVAASCHSSRKASATAPHVAAVDALATRRDTLAALAAAAVFLAPGLARADPSAEATSSSSSDLKEFSNTKQQYRLDIPAVWDAKGKAGADALFEDPAKRSTSVGVTVNPVKVKSIEDFGGLDEVVGKLLAAERAKASEADDG